MNFNKHKLIKNKYDYVWITSPFILQFINLEKIRYSKLIYDCMDDYLAFPQDDHSIEYLRSLENQLLERADIVLVSSKRLQELVRERGFRRPVHLVYNALEPNNSYQDSNIKGDDGFFNIVYFGTISEWFDFNSIFELLRRHEDIRFTIIGPSEVSLPHHERINYTGPVKYEELKRYARDADAFIMPFVLNSLVESVDPVKVYEYTAYLKPTFVVRYRETEKFEDIAFLYNDVEELSSQVELAKNRKLHKMNERKLRQFIYNNSWDSRARQIFEILERDI
ncbi:hypothetical protein DNHGIG_12110 [Collibacillus ludicampi]|uniref:Spore protein YkvP/CgeB glycosyl transferase-like domain-containing protein n=1 Tax=Collibacillus ludicampi TaxID=2771369 RepID=A0AAV4LCY4_9BACL|nr:hypothetical protein DNHGIG_12110 [Collibacillus ludicampi]